MAGSKNDFDEAAYIIENIVDGDKCYLDHHGFCQTHGWMSDDECVQARARKWLKKNRPDLWKEIFNSAQQPQV